VLRGRVHMRSSRRASLAFACRETLSALSSLANSDARDNGENEMAEADNAGVVVRPPLLYAAALAAMLVLRWLRPLPILGGAAFWPGLALVALAARRRVL